MYCYSADPSCKGLFPSSYLGKQDTISVHVDFYPSPCWRQPGFLKNVPFNSSWSVSLWSCSQTWLLLGWLSPFLSPPVTLAFLSTPGSHCILFPWWKLSACLRSPTLPNTITLHLMHICLRQVSVLFSHCLCQCDFLCFFFFLMSVMVFLLSQPS